MVSVLLLLALLALLRAPPLLSLRAGDTCGTYVALAHRCA
jgi:hypothetical protein